VCNWILGGDPRGIGVFGQRSFWMFNRSEKKVCPATRAARRGFRFYGHEHQPNRRPRGGAAFNRAGGVCGARRFCTVYFCGGGRGAFSGAPGLQAPGDRRDGRPNHGGLFKAGTGATPGNDGFEALDSGLGADPEGTNRPCAGLVASHLVLSPHAVPTSRMRPIKAE
jgi:hypothetical protein